jgi:hypothetical protein
MATSPDTEPKSVNFRIGVEGKPAQPVDATLFAFDARGDLIASSPVVEGAAQLDVRPFRLKNARLFVAPTMPEGRAGKPTIKTMERVRAYEPTFRFERGKRTFELLPIPDILWPGWKWCTCRVRGRVLKVETLGGVTYEKRVCHARVHICEVDRLPFIISVLPEEALWRLRDELIVALERPFPPDPNPPDPPFRIDPGDLQPAPLLRAANVFGRRDDLAKLNPQPEPPGLSRRLLSGVERVALNPQPLPPKAMTISMPVELRSSLITNSARVLREALVEHIELLRPFWCHWDWLDPYLFPYFYRCEELAVIETDENGRFDTTIWYPCSDRPDLYFWVESSVGGSWETVYHPPIRCNTYWNFACGSEVTLRIRDPRVHGCGQRPEPPLGKKVVVKTIGRQVSMGEIYRNAPAAAQEGQVKEGWLDPVKPSPFGAVLEPRVDFGSGLKPAGVTHYRWSYRTLGSTAEADWRVVHPPLVHDPVRRHYRVATPPGAPVVYNSETISVQLGPDTATTGFFIVIDPVLPADGEDWEILDESFDLASAYFDTSELSPGKYELKLELFRNAAGVMTRVDLTAEGVELYEITDPAPLVEGSFTTTAATGDRTLIDAGTGHVVGYRLVLHVDNRDCFGTINDVVLSGAPAGRCGFLEYSDPEDEALISFRASHPDDFATFTFRLVRVTTDVAEGLASGLVEDLSVNGFARIGDTFSKPLSVDTLMSSGLPAGETPCTRAAFAEELHVAALATNGYDRLSTHDAPRAPEVDLRAFAITHS